MSTHWNMRNTTHNHTHGYKEIINTDDQQLQPPHPAESEVKTKVSVPVLRPVHHTHSHTHVRIQPSTFFPPVYVSSDKHVTFNQSSEDSVLWSRPSVCSQNAQFSHGRISKGRVGLALISECLQHIQITVSSSAPKAEVTANCHGRPSYVGSFGL